MWILCYFQLRVHFHIISISKVSRREIDILRERERERERERRERERERESVEHEWDITL